MADLQTRIAAARAEGYNDDEIVGFLSQSNARVSQALQEGYAPSEIVQFLTAGAATRPTTAAAIPGAAPGQMAPPAAPGEQPLAPQIMRQVGLAGRAGAEGLASFAGLVTDPLAAIINQFVPPERRLSTLRSVMSTLLTEAGVPQPQTPTERVVQEASGAVAGGGAQVQAARQVAQAVPGAVRTIAQQLTTQPGAQLTGAAGAGGGAQTAAEAGAGPAGQIAAGLAGATAGSLAATRQAVPSPAAADIQAAEQAGVRLLTSDVRPPTGVVGTATERVAEAIPVTGLAPVRRAQQRERVESVRQLLADYNVSSSAADAPAALVADVVAKRSADLTRLTQSRDEVLRRLSPVAPVTPSKTQAAINAELAKLQPGAGTPEVDRVIADLQSFATNIQGKSLEGLEIERRLLRDRYSDPSVANIKAFAEPITNRLYAAVVSDIGDFIKTNGRPNDYTKWRSANTTLSNMAGELNSNVLKATLNKGDVTPEVVERMLFSNKPSEVRLLFNNLSPAGREVAKVAVLRRAGLAATDLGERGAEGVIDPTRFAKEVDRLGVSVGVMFRPEEIKRIEGLVRVLNLTRRAQQAQEPVQFAGGQIPVGVPRVIGIGAVGRPVFDYLSTLLGNPFIGAAATTGAGLSIGALARFYESRPVRNLLVKLSATRPGSRAETELITALSALKVSAPEEETQ